MTSNAIHVESSRDLQPDVVALCSIHSAGAVFGIDTRKIREVFDRRHIRKVPLAPFYIGGLIPYRGEVLATISLRALLGKVPGPEEASVLVLEDPSGQERFGLAVDSVEGVRNVARCTLESNPSTLNNRTEMVFAGTYQTELGLIIHLDPCRLLPSRLAQMDL
jgi:purine-binding chemotaxis protein CheW